MDSMDEVAFNNARAYWDMFYKTLFNGNLVKPRGLVIREIEDLQLTIDPRSPFMSHKSRKYNVAYFKKEMIWKLGASKYDTSIKQHAKMWESVQNPDGTFNSNYGQYWFGEQNGFWFVVQELMRDPDSRRAVIPMLSKEHLKPETVDTVCTEAVGFRIRDNKLNMSIHMRSSDQIFGLGTDIPTFAFLYRLVLGVLQMRWPLVCGNMTITAMSSHIYERHFDLVTDMMSDGLDGTPHVFMPFCSGSEALCIVAGRGKNFDGSGVLGAWLSS